MDSLYAEHKAGLLLIASSIIGFIFVLLTMGSCQTQKQWNKKGFQNGWIDTSTTYKRDTIHFFGGTKDTLFHWTKDSLILKDSRFTTTIYSDTVHHTIYARTLVNNRDTTVVREIHTTKYTQVKATVWDALKEVWWLFIVIGVLFLIIIIRR